ncbi:MAG: hypothetical protein DF168_00622 [Candidatus Moanabacter tarae]|uniref:Uncharacterized protein n=1 Tax=Candidatus Moanibacter tarae TaxID=2200854 RepID=A0A2Z4ABN4_9BACT|nr:MAG: hypothetical protein DF168_00622 [Candidatus Moanabacter tarae]
MNELRTKEIFLASTESTTKNKQILTAEQHSELIPFGNAATHHLQPTKSGFMEYLLFHLMGLSFGSLAQILITRPYKPLIP